MNGPKSFPFGGIYLPETGIKTADTRVRNADVPALAIVPLKQHLGVEAECVVSVGDRVREGTLIGRPTGTISSAVHSPIPGTVVEIKRITLPDGTSTKAVAVELGGEFERFAKTDQGVSGMSDAELLGLIAGAGVVGLGGTAFPTHLKLGLPRGKSVEYLIVNGIESEPYLCADRRLMFERAREVMEGIRIAARLVKPRSVLVGIDELGVEAAEAMRRAAAEAGVEAEIVALAHRYPQGDERRLVQALIGRTIPSGKLPLDVGAVVSCVATLFSVYEAVVLRKPLIERLVTVSGDAVRAPAVLKVRIGTPLGRLFEECGGLVKIPERVVVGGPLMGRSVVDLGTPVTKGTQGLLALSAEEVNSRQRTSCIACGRCISVCPAEINPMRLFKLVERGLGTIAFDEGLLDCRECGCCSYVCPAHLPLRNFQARQGASFRGRVVDAPHLHANDTTASIMWTVVLCLLPSGAWGVWSFGLPALYVMIVAVAAAVLSEWLLGLQSKRSTIKDGSAFLAGLLVGYNMPPGVPLYVPAAASAFALVVIKWCFGGLGANWMNPALGGRIFAFVSWTGALTTWSAPRAWPSGGPLAAQAPLAFVRNALVSGGAVGSGGPMHLLTAQGYPMSPGSSAVSGWLSRVIHLNIDPHYFDLFIGNVPGAIGEVSVVLLLLGVIFLFRARLITWHIPIAFLGALALLTWVLGGIPYGGGLFTGDVAFQLLTGGAVLGAFFMATDPVTSPVSTRGALIFGAGAGVLAFFIRTLGSPQEGVAFSIIVLNIAVPVIDRADRLARARRRLESRP